MLPTKQPKKHSHLLIAFLGIGSTPFLLLIILVIVVIFLVPLIMNKEESNLQDDGMTAPIALFRPFYEEMAKKYQLPWEVLAGAHFRSPVFSEHAAQLSGSIEGAKYSDLILAAVQKYNQGKKYPVSPALIAGIIQQESGFNPNVVSSAGAVGLMQLMPFNCSARGWSIEQCKIPANNIDRGTEIISGHLQKYNGNLPYALAAYNAGAGNVKKYGGVPPFSETQNYVKKVPLHMAKFTGSSNLNSIKSYIDEIAQQIRKEANSQKETCKSEAKNQIKDAINTYPVDVICGLVHLDSKYSKYSGWDYVKEVTLQADIYAGRVTYLAGAKDTGGIFIWPVDKGRITGIFGENRGDHRHRGLDLASPINTFVRAAYDGEVYIDKDDPGGFGHYIGIKHPNGLITWYGHTVPYGIQKGSKVQKGQVIGQIKLIGRTTGAHLHFEVHVGETPSMDARDPLRYLQKK